MAPSLRHRAALILTGALISAPLWGAAAAVATTPTVTFTGTPLLNLGAVSCPSNPSVGTLTVAAGSTVDFANRLGKPATLWAGDSHKHLKDGEMVPVTFTSGPASIVLQMLPDCSLDLGTHQQMTVAVTAPPTPDHSKGSHKLTPSAGASNDSGSGVTGSGTDGTDGTDQTGAPAPGSTGNDDPFAPATVTDTAGTVTLGDPIGANSTTNGASGLLTLIATVCVVGVSAAAIRAIIAQRATRALMA